MSEVSKGYEEKTKAKKRDGWYKGRGCNFK